MERWKTLLVSGTLGTAFGLAGAMITAVLLGIYDLGRGGPDRPRLDRQWIQLPEWGVFMSRADAAVLIVGVVIALLASHAFRVLLRRR